MTGYLVFGLSYAFACVVQPGPFQAYLFSQSLTNGWRKTIPLVFAPLISDLPVIILVVFVLTKVPHQVLLLLQVLGGLFMLFLAFKVCRTLLHKNRNREQNSSQYGNMFKAVIVNLLNPNPYLGWSLVMGPMLIKGWDSNPVNGIILITGFYVSMIFYSILMIVFFSAAGNSGPRINLISSVISVFAFGFFGIYQLWLGIKGFL